MLPSPARRSIVPFFISFPLFLLTNQISPALPKLSTLYFIFYSNQKPPFTRTQTYIFHLLLMNNQESGEDMKEKML